MLAKRIIPCLDIKNGRTVKGTNFLDLKDAGDPLELSQYYAKNGADELVFLDISATQENRATLVDLVNQIAKKINIPFTVGGGIGTLDDVKKVINAGCDKVSVNSAAIKNPSLIEQIANEFGSQALVVAIDAKLINGEWRVFVSGGNIMTSLGLLEWAKQVQNLGAGEILFTSMDHDGIKNGFAIEVLKELEKNVNIPIIASGGAGKINDFINLFQQTTIDAALAASVFHYHEVDIVDLKKQLYLYHIPIRI